MGDFNVGLCAVRSPLLSASWLVSFPPLSDRFLGRKGERSSAPVLDSINPTPTSSPPGWDSSCGPSIDGNRLYLKPMCVNTSTHCHLVCELHRSAWIWHAKDLAADSPCDSDCYHTRKFPYGAMSTFLWTSGTEPHSRVFRQLDSVAEARGHSTRRTFSVRLAHQ
jgi:hypothetical protein